MIFCIVHQDGARYDNNGNRIKRPASNKFPRQQVKNLLIPKQAVPKQSRPLIKVQKKKYQQYQPTKVVSNKFIQFQSLKLYFVVSMIASIYLIAFILH